MEKREIKVHYSEPENFDEIYQDFLNSLFGSEAVEEIILEGDKP